VKKYAGDAKAKAIASRYCGIALQNRNSSLVSFGDMEKWIASAQIF